MTENCVRETHDKGMLGRMGACLYYVGNSSAIVRGAQRDDSFSPSPLISAREFRDVGWRCARQEVEQIPDGSSSLRVADEGDLVGRAPSPRFWEFIGAVDNCLPCMWSRLRLYQGVKGKISIINANKRRGRSWSVKATALVNSTQDSTVKWRRS